MRTRDSIKREIQKHQDDIEQLNKELIQLLIEDNKQSEPKAKEESPSRPHRRHKKRSTPFNVGDTLIITNDYKSKKGTRGTVTRSVGDFTFIQDQYGTVHQRAHHNLKKTHTNHE